MGTIDTFEHEFLSEFIVALSDTSTKLCEEDFASSGYNNDNPKVTTTVVRGIIMATLRYDNDNPKVTTSVPKH